MTTTLDGYPITTCTQCGKDVCSIPSTDERYRSSILAGWDIWKTGTPQAFTVNHDITEHRAGERHTCNETHDGHAARNHPATEEHE